MKKITVLGPLPPWKGVSQYVKGFVKALGEKISVQVLDFKSMYPEKLYPGGSPLQKGVTTPQYEGVISLQILTWWNPFSRLKAGFSINGEVLHMQYWIWFLSPMYVIVALVARRWKKIPVIVTVHNVQPHEISRWKLFLDKIVYFVADRFVVHSEDNKLQLRKIIGEGKEIQVFPHGLIMPEVEKISLATARSELGISLDKKVILFFGHIRPYKGLGFLLSSFSQLIRQDSSYHLIIGGKCREDRDEQYQSVIDKKNLNNYITRIPGFLDDQQLSQVFSASDLMVLPYTHFDAQSGVVALGLGYNIPMIVSDLGGLTEVIDDERYVFEVNNTNELLSKILNLNFSEGRRFIVEKQKVFEWGSVTNGYIETCY